MSFFNRTMQLAFVSFVAIASFFNPSKAESSDCFNCCNFSICDWDFTVGADYLYWKPCTSTLDYAVTMDRDPFSNPPPSNSDPIYFNIKSVCPDYESGYRVYFSGSSFCGSSVGLAGSYTQLKADKNSEASADKRTLLPTVLHPYQEQYLINEYPDAVVAYPGSKADWESNYHEWSFGGTYHTDWSCNSRMGYFFGITGMNYDEDFDVYFSVQIDGTIEDVILSSKSSLNYNGCGIKFGSQYEYNLCRGLNVFADANGSILIGDGDNETIFGFRTIEGSNTVAPDYVFEKKDCCRVVPGYHIGLGVNYDTCLCNLNLNLRIGYEFVGWYNLPFYRTYVEGIEDLDVVENPELFNMAISSSAETQDLSYHGMFVGVAVKF